MLVSNERWNYVSELFSSSGFPGVVDPVHPHRVGRGIELGTFGGKYDPDKVAVLTIAAADGMGIPLSLADPGITPASATQDVMAALRALLRPDG